jgi:transcriptional regulator of arginine metabolism
MNKSFRHGQILKLIRSGPVYTQDELAKELKTLGVPATQVTLSRDIRELGLLKTQEGYRQVAAAPAGRDLATVAGEFLQDVRVAQNLMVLRTSPGNANTLAVALDQQEWPEIVGTLAGDDTILVVAPDANTAVKLQQRLMRYLQAD